MRKNYNPNKDQPLVLTPFFHQVIIPIYIPENTDFYNDSLRILEICLQSLFKTCHKRTYFTCVNNGSKSEVKDYLNNLFEQGFIHEVIHTTNVGKVNSILKGLKGHDFDLVTISDADVLFLEGWQEEAYKMFQNFDKLAALSTCPNPKLLKFHTWSIFSEFLFSNKLKFTKVEDPSGLKQFAESISNPDLFKPCHYDKNLSLTINEISGVLGAGHFVVTYRKELFEDFTLQFSDFKLGGDSEASLDLLASQKGYWRLATTKSYSLHMGNIREPWMDSYLHELSENESPISNLSLPPLKKRNEFVIFMKFSLTKILLKDYFFKKFLRNKGLDLKYISTY